MKTAPNFVLPRPPPCDVLASYASVIGLFAAALDDRFDRPQGTGAVDYFAPYPIFCLKVDRISFSLAPALSSIFPIVTISFLRS